ncbi:MAG: DUF3142 domain-containing protein [Bryobacterales bacterium]|nr:DUF3142 domain-containing protein [Bryobacterales bacterium]
MEALPSLQTSTMAVLAQARERRIQIEGVQLDIDCPTGSLKAYAQFLRKYRMQLPKGTQLSITALLDWFRDGTAIADVLREVDEFVPQYYDAFPTEPGQPAIATPFTANEWAPLLNRFGKRYRIGVSTFGRSRVTQPGASYNVISPDLRVIDVGVSPGFTLQASQTPARELILRYRALREAKVGYSRFEAGSVVEFTIATPESVRAAVEQARRMGGHCAGVLFFRWPARGETLALTPSEVLHAGKAGRPQSNEATLQTRSRGCAAVSCAELIAEFRGPLAIRARRYRIRTSLPLEYFLPAEGIPVRMTGPSELQFTVPPYCTRGRVPLGRAVTVNESKFELEEMP